MQRCMMIEELKILLRARPENTLQEEYRVSIVDDNILHKPSSSA
jgi:hypothetical protein